MPITTPPTAPSRTDPTTFPDRADAWVAWQETSLVPQINALEANVNAREASAVAAANTATAAVTGINTALNRYIFSTNTAMADPGVGFVRFNNATLAAVTAIAIDAQSSDTGNPNILGILANFSASTSTVKGLIRFTQAGVPGTFAAFNVAAVTNNTGWVQLAVAHVGSAGTFGNNVSFIMEFHRTGDPGGVTLDTAQTITGVKTFSSQIVASGGVQGNVTGNVTGNAGTVTNGVYTTGAQTVGGVKTFTSTVSVSKQSGVDDTPGFAAATTGGTFASMWTRRGAPFLAVGDTTGSSYAPALAHQYFHNSGFAGVYSVGVLNFNGADTGTFVVHHIDRDGGNDRVWQFYGGTGAFHAPGNIATDGQFIGNGGGLTNVPASAIANALNAPGSAPIYACRAWVNFNGTGTVAIRASGNVSSITDNGVGDYTVNFTTAMPDAHYSVVGMGGLLGTVNTASSIKFRDDLAVPTTAGVRIAYGGTEFTDAERISVAIFR